MSDITATDPAADNQPAARVEDADYWYSLIPEKPAGKFCDLTDRAMQKYRQTGEGPRFVRISSRCIRYRRIDLKAWADSLMRSSTSDPDQAAA